MIWTLWFNVKSARLEIRSTKLNQRRTKRLHYSIMFQHLGNSGTQNNNRSLFLLLIRPNTEEYKWKNKPEKGTKIPRGNNGATFCLNRTSSYHHLVSCFLWVFLAFINQQLSNWSPHIHSGPYSIHSSHCHPKALWKCKADQVIHPLIIFKTSISSSCC